MPSRLVLQFLGLPQIELDDKPITIDRRKAIALLAYLAVNDVGATHQKHSRESLSALLWPDYEQAKAFSNLRHIIWDLHQALGEGWLIAERESVRLNPDAKVDLDVARFRDLLTQGRQQTDISLSTSLLAEVVKLYRNHLLTGFSLKDAYPFNEWAYAESEGLRHQLLDALSILAEDYCRLDQAEKAISYARRLVALDPLNESAHRQLMEVFVQAGQHSEALKQYQTCEQILRKELNLDPQPETRALYKKIRKGEIKPVRVEIPTEIITPKHNLPLQLSTFVGREKEQSEIVSLLEKNRLVTLAGAGGIGKTRLALHVGGKILSDYRDGVWFIPLDSLSNPTLVPQTVASVFDIRERPDRSVNEILINVLREKTTLLILDNCEHLLDSCVQLVTSLLTQCPNLKILATSREILNMNGEAVYYLPSLSIPEDDKLLAEQLTEYESIQLFTERAALAQSSFALTQENAQTVVNICRRVDGIPLAIELASARVNILQVKEIWRQLNDSFLLLASDGRSILPRQQTLQASMDWSWGLLSEAERRFLQQLPVFAGGWTLESAQAVCGGNVLALTSSLVKKSLITVDQKSEGDTRYRFHEIVRQYMREKLIESGEEENIRTRHLKYFLKLSKQIETELIGSRQIEWFARTNDELNNMRASLEYAAQKNVVEAGLHISGRLRHYWIGFDMHEGIRWLTEFIQKPDSNAYPRPRAKALLAQGWLLVLLLKIGEARAVAQECLALYRACQDQHGEIDGLLVLAHITFASSNINQSMELVQQALKLSRSLGDRYREAEALNRLVQYGPDITRSLAYFEQAISLNRQIKNWMGLASTLDHAGERAVKNSNLQMAEKYAKEAMSLFRQLKHRGGLSNVMQTFGRIAFARGDLEQAHASLRESIEIGQEIGYDMNCLWSRTHLGYCILSEGNIAEARAIFAEVAREFSKNKMEIGVVFSLEGMAGLFNIVGKPEIAARLVGWADAMREKIPDPRPLLEQADVDKIIAACLARMGEVAFSDAYDEGQQMPFDEAVAYALSENQQ
jgi:predicted ATPase/DNA-binding SARP family transcriptional activator